MRKFKITYWRGGDCLVEVIEAKDKSQAKRIFYMTVDADDFSRIEEVTDDV